MYFQRSEYKFGTEIILFVLEETRTKYVNFVSAVGEDF